MALREAARKLATPHLSDVTIFTTLEPCPMCVGALLECDVAALVYAVPNPVDGAAGTVLQLAQHPSLGRRLQVCRASGARRRRSCRVSSTWCPPAPDRGTAPQASGNPLLSSPAERCPSG